MLISGVQPYAYTQSTSLTSKTKPAKQIPGNTQETQTPTNQPSFSSNFSSDARPESVTVGGVNSRTQFQVTQSLKQVRAERVSGTKSKPLDIVTDKQINKATNGDKEISALLKMMRNDAKGNSILKKALDKGTTYKRGDLPENMNGLTKGGHGKPVVILKKLSLGTVVFQTAAAATIGDPNGMDSKALSAFRDELLKRLGL